MSKQLQDISVEIIRSFDKFNYDEPTVRNVIMKQAAVDDNLGFYQVVAAKLVGYQAFLAETVTKDVKEYFSSECKHLDDCISKSAYDPEHDFSILLRRLDNLNRLYGK